jgi:hypothetical protein
MLDTDGAVVHLNATTPWWGRHQRSGWSPAPYADITRLVSGISVTSDELVRKRYLQALLAMRPASTGQRASSAPSVTIPPWTVDRSVDDIAASIYSLSSSAPHLFGKHLRPSMSSSA